MKKLKVTSRRTRRNVIVTLPLLDDSLSDAGILSLIPEDGGASLVAEYDQFDKRLHFIIDQIVGGKDRVFSIDNSSDTAADTAASWEQGKKSADLILNNKQFLCYHYDPAYAKPFINPLNGPTGVSLLRDPMPAGCDGEHPWQRGINFMHGDINGAQCWNEPYQTKSGYGRTDQESIVLNQSPVSASMVSQNIWTDHTGERLVSDERSVRVFALPDWPAVMDLRLSLIASEGPVILGSTKEAGFLSVRVAPSMNGKATGKIENCYGAVTEKECWGKPAQWMDYSGEVNGGTVGIAILDDPENLRYPTRWHVREYGLFSPNIWLWDESHTIPKGETLTLRWRLVIHSGDAQDAGIKDFFLDYDSGIRGELIEDETGD